MMNDEQERKLADIAHHVGWLHQEAVVMRKRTDPVLVGWFLFIVGAGWIFLDHWLDGLK